MSRLVDSSISIYEALQNIKNGKYVMPAFQRQYVWSMEQVEKLWDSILLDYPIATFLFWHVDDDNVTWDTYFCNFLYEVTFDNRKQADTVNYELSNINVNQTDTAVLDGQQRLTSLFLSLFGNAFIRQKYARRKNSGGIVTKLLIELNKNKITVDEEEYNSKKYDIKFSEKVGKLSPTQFEIKNILEQKFQDDSTRDKAIEEAIFNVPADSKDYARNILNKLYNKIFVEKLIRYTEIHDMKQDDALEMFVRFNSGGKALRKSEITMSILEAYWPSAKTEFGKLLVDSYEGFGSDFIIRSALMIYGDVVKSNISKNIAEELKNNWSEFKKALKNLESTLKEIKIGVSRFASSWNVLLPIIYFIYYNPEYRNNLDGIRAYLIRAVLFTYFQSGTTGKLQQMKSRINENDYEITVDMLNQMNDLRVTEGKIEDILNEEKGSRVAGEALYFLSLDWRNTHFKYEQDHLHPFERFDGNKPISVSMEDWRKWRGNRNRLANLHLLEGRSNASKSDMRLVDYYNDMNVEQRADFHRQSFIPEGISLELEKFEEFYEARKAILTGKIRELLG
ncbi:Uncharacterized conserved protein, contains ParB-like and HNH nuclease domains [Proteiniborus ethanoligenes]|uniref:Uncharacterized conserved protein, contains ParB-like and HNH nuclease domains n=1 Tax=Proteiniborus ethanoligenes TaxID=415015 RepID=A0A1H3QGC9_9FIRM|nr:DUF262 domain-containing protein [Proteiniborus ethanoligenes]SDZ11769.1 Uncharacterized conserved protein, contains ParB-like and HNH nuclease domains [Proteiniborus ethanoligenes]